MGRVSLMMKMFVRMTNRRPDALDILGGEQFVYQFDLRGEKPFNIRVLPDKKLKFQPGTAEKPDVTFTADRAVFYKLIVGQLSQDEAFVNRKIEVKGSILASAKFRRLANSTLNAHKTALKFLPYIMKLVPM